MGTVNQGTADNFAELIEEGKDLNSTSTVTAALDIRFCAGVFVQVISTGSVSVVKLQTSGNGTDWVDHHMNVEITGNGGQCVTPVIANYVRLKVTTAEGSPQTGTLIIQGK